MYGHTFTIWTLSETKATMMHFEKLKPPNHGYRRRVAALLQSYADKPSEETKKQLAEILPLEVFMTLTTERAREFARLARKRERRLNDSVVSDLIAKMRTIVREARRRGMCALILIEAIDHNSLRKTELQGTLLRGRKLLKNLARYEGATLRLVRASGKLCPRCGSKGNEIIHTRRSRIHQCPKCGLRWDRDKAVHYNLVYSYFKRMIREESDDDSVMAERVLATLREWLERHQNAMY
jgi:predicted RNA-binding Zn-ribbon protein involved in translation (DUF1610 family)